MIKLIAAKSMGGRLLELRFSDGATGVYDFGPIVDTVTAMTDPLRDPDFFGRYYIELGALAWPNGLDFSAGSLYRRLQDEGKLKRDVRAA
ncbi:DUF2442 domain-containing protein [Dyella flagellata]|uniref:DUF2442 domain-containing protein n=1 Tax=Dyella flagellata TaxID=1867833 RepID=A0ABQ5XGF3_9GAMM|nr:DUF2442 domain-containing protein [Dyella flagellata]GLQ90264.1 hypothetical protein GCM10007898_38390 [Dyella flagellata]